MKPPICKVCGSSHWTYEEHKITGLEEVRKLGASVLRNTVTKRTVVPTMSPPTVPTDTDCPHVMPAEELTPQCACGKPRDGRHSSCAACRKRAYRERSRG
jgi:hypothetical protein